MNSKFSQQVARQKKCVAFSRESLNRLSMIIRMCCQSQLVKQVAQNAHQKNCFTAFAF